MSNDAKKLASALAQRHVPEPSYTIAGFCLAEGITKTTYHKLRNLGLGPREMRNLSLVRISHRARLDWQAARENPVGAEAKAVRETRDEMRKRSRAAAERAVKSPKHVSAGRRAKAVA